MWYAHDDDGLQGVTVSFARCDLQLGVRCGCGAAEETHRLHVQQRDFEGVLIYRCVRLRAVLQAQRQHTRREVQRCDTPLQQHTMARRHDKRDGCTAEQPARTVFDVMLTLSELSVSA